MVINPFVGACPKCPSSNYLIIVCSTIGYSVGELVGLAGSSDNVMLGWCILLLMVINPFVGACLNCPSSYYLIALIVLCYISSNCLTSFLLKFIL